ncbi:MAG TPA: HD domain-containing phosphohydrolase [Gemmatimonadaceae bacterium]|nr:HD domain-containing phosphohydrolase [Gemmatimonadaceae bacterium]
MTQSSTGPFRNARVLVADDEPSNARLLSRILERAGFRHVRATSDARTVLPLYRDMQPDVVLLDLHMPHVDGFGLLVAFRHEVPEGELLPVLVITGDPSADARAQAHRLGARDYIVKPFDAADIVMRVERLLELRAVYRQLRTRNEALEREVRDYEDDLEQAQLEMMRRLADTAEHHDGGAEGHTLRVGDLAAGIGAELGLHAADCERLRQAAPLHDVGKVGLRDAILMKPGRLDPAEFEIAERHTLIGATILAGSRFPLMRLAEEIALTHHERWDGKGYPRGLAGEAIPLSGRIVAAADVFDALTHIRPYKPAWSVSAALEELRLQRGRQFDPDVVDALLRMYGVEDAPPASGETRRLGSLHGALRTSVRFPHSMPSSARAQAPAVPIPPEAGEHGWGQRLA